MNKEMTAREILAEASRINGSASRSARERRLREFRNRVTEFIHEFSERGEGPSLKEMECVLEDLEDRLERMRRYDE